MSKTRINMTFLTLVTFKRRKFFSAAFFLTNGWLGFLIVIVDFLLFSTITVVNMLVPD